MAKKTKKKVTRREFLKTAGAASLALSGAIPFTGRRGHAAKKEVLKVTAPPWVYKKYPLEECMTKFEKDHPNVKVKRLRAPDLLPAAHYLPSFRVGDDVTDIHISGSGAELAPLIMGDWIEPVDDILTGDLAVNEFVPAAIKGSHFKRPDGKGTFYAGVPFFTQFIGFACNKRIYEKAGMLKDGKPLRIRTWNKEEVLGYFKKLSEAAPTGIGILQVWDREATPWTYGTGLLAMRGKLISDHGPWWDVESDEAKYWLSLLQELNKKGYALYLNTNDEGITKWKTGIAASMFGVTTAWESELARVPGWEDALAYSTFPGMEKHGTIADSYMAWIPKLSKKKELAKIFLKEQVASKYFQQWNYNHYGKLPTIKRYFDDGLKVMSDMVPVFQQMLDRAKPFPTYRDHQKYWDVFMKYLPRVANLQISVEEGLEGIKKDQKGLDFSVIEAEA